MKLAMLLAPALSGIHAAQCETARLTKASTTEVSLWGDSVAIDGDRLAMKVADGENDMVRVFEKEGGVWMPAAVLDGIGIDDSAGYGDALALSGNTLAVAAPNDDTLGPDSGAVFVYERLGGTWVQSAKLFADGPGDGFGRTLALDGDVIVVGSFMDDDAGDNAGHVNIWQRNAGGFWIHEVTLTGSDTAAGDAFGYTLALDGNTLVVGARLDDDGAENGGTAFVFEHQSGPWVETAKLVPTSSTAFAPYETLDVEGDTIAMGCPNGAVFSIGTVAIFNFNRVGDVWVETQNVYANPLVSFDQFGISVAIANHRILVGSKGPVGGENLGAIYVFEDLGGPLWFQQGPKTVGDGVGFGMSLCADGDRLATRVTEGLDVSAVRILSFQQDECPSLFSKQMYASVSAGGMQTMTLSTNIPLDLYFVLGSLTGTQPGIPIHIFTLPLVIDSYFMFTANNPNTPPLGSSLGFLDSEGEATTTFTVPPGLAPAFVGLTFFHAAVTLDLASGFFTHASNATVVILTP